MQQSHVHYHRYQCLEQHLPDRSYDTGYVLGLWVCVLLLLLLPPLV